MSLDIFMSTLARAFSYVLPIVGVIALIYLILFLKQLIETLKQVSKTLDTANDQLKKLDAPLKTAENISNTVDEVNQTAKEAFMNALTMDMALGCSTNSMLHLPAIAHEAGVELNVDIANEISARTPNLCHLAPAGHTYIEDLNEAGGIYAVMNEISKKGLLNLDCMTVTGKTVGENIKDCVNKNPDVIRPIDNPYSQTGGIAILKGNLAPDSGVVKRSAVAPEMLKHEGPARVFECEEDAIAAI